MTLICFTNCFRDIWHILIYLFSWLKTQLVILGGVKWVILLIVVIFLLYLIFSTIATAWCTSLFFRFLKRIFDFAKESWYSRKWLACEHFEVFLCIQAYLIRIIIIIVEVIIGQILRIMTEKLISFNERLLCSLHHLVVDTNFVVIQLCDLSQRVSADLAHLIFADIRDLSDTNLGFNWLIIWVIKNLWCLGLRASWYQ